MAFKVKNFRFANGTVYVGNNKVDFDNDGVGEIESEDTFKSLLTLPNFFAVEDTENDSEGNKEPENDGDKEPEKDSEPVEPKEEDKVPEEPVEPKEENKVPEEPKAPTLVSSDNLSVKELDAKAKELGIEVSGTKSDKAKAINDYIIANF